MPLSIFAQKSGYSPEMEILNYPFMREVASLIKNTDHNITRPDANLKVSKNCVYDLFVHKIIDGEIIDTKGKKNISFKINGDYLLRISYRNYSLNSMEADWDRDYIFEVDGILFCGGRNLIPYFTSCKIKKRHLSFDFEGSVSLSSRFWEFVIKEGKVVKAFYHYEDNEIDLDIIPVYDLLNKKIIPFSEQRKEQPFKSLY